jgi:hypothetical protein
MTGTTELESRVGDALAGRVDRPFPVEHLREQAIRRAGAIRRRRRILGTAAAALIVVCVIALVRSPGVGAPGTTLPLETAAPPGGVGSDPGLLHFDLDPGVLGDRVASTEWISGLGYERVTARDAEDAELFTVYLAPDVASIDRLVAVRHDVEYQQLRWQPADGVFGMVVTIGDDDRLRRQVAAAVRTDRVQRCVMPLRLAELPPDATWSECQTKIRRGAGAGPVWVYSGLTIERADRHAVFIWADGRPMTSPSFHADRTAAGYPAQWLAGGQSGTGLWLLAFGPYQLYITGVDYQRADWLTPQDATWLAQRLTPSTDLNNPASWPRRAVG